MFSKKHVLLKKTFLVTLTNTSGATFPLQLLLWHSKLTQHRNLQPAALAACRPLPQPWAQWQSLSPPWNILEHVRDLNA